MNVIVNFNFQYSWNNGTSSTVIIYTLLPGRLGLIDRVKLMQPAQNVD